MGIKARNWMFVIISIIGLMLICKADSMYSTNYRMESTTFASGGNVSSTDYQLEDAFAQGISTENKSSTNFMIFEGFHEMNIDEVYNATRDQFAIAAWVKRDSNMSDYQPIACRWNDSRGYTERSFCLLIDSDDRIKMFVSRDGTNYTSVTSKTRVTEHQWYFIVGAYNNTDLKIYINGIEDNSTYYLNGIYDTDRAMSLGGAYFLNQMRYFNGTIDEIAYYNVTFSDIEVVREYEAEKKRFEILISDSPNFEPENIRLARVGISANMSPEYYDDDYTVLLENFESEGMIARNNASEINVTLNKGKEGQSAEFDGTSGHVEYPDTDRYNASSFTIEAWVKTNSSQEHVILSKGIEHGTEGTGYELYMNNGLVTFLIDDGTSSYDTVTSTTNIADNRWHHVSAVKYSNDIGTTNVTKIYIDTQLEGTTTIINSLNKIKNSNPVVVGTDAGKDNYFFNGSIDGLRISDIARLPMANLTKNYLNVSEIGEELDYRTLYWKVRITDVDARSELKEKTYSDWSETRTLQLIPRMILQLESPANHSGSSTISNTFVFTPINPMSMEECSLIIDGEVNKTSYYVISNTVNSISTDLNEGSYYWSINCTDNLTQSENSEVRYFIVDVTDPVPTLNLSKSIAEFGNDTVDVNWSFTDLNPILSYATVYYPSGSILVNSTENVTLTSENLTGLGNYSVTVTAIDIANNINTTSGSFEVQDTLLPNLTIAGPADNSITNATTTAFQIYAGDAHSISNCSLRVNDEVKLTNFTLVSNYSLLQSLVLTNLSDNLDYEWNITCYDNSSNENASDSRTLTVDTVAPNMSYVYPTGELYAADSNLTLNASIDDVHPDSVLLRWNGTNYLFNSTSRIEGDINYTYEEVYKVFDIGSLVEGRYTYYLWTNDTAGNSNKLPTRTFVMDITVPTTFNLTSPENETDNTDQSPAFNWEGSYDDNLDNYVLEISRYNTFTSIDKSYETTTSYYQISDDDSLEDGIRYYWKVTAYDRANNSYTSDTFEFVVGTGYEEVYISSPSGGGGGGGGGTKAVPGVVNILEPGPISMYLLDTVTTPIFIVNKGKGSLKRVELTVESSDPAIQVELNPTSFPTVPAGEKVVSKLKIKSEDVEGQYEITVRAEVADPYQVDTAKFYVNLVGFGMGRSSIVDEKITFLENLFESNPKCLELKELLDQAKEANANEQHEKALSLVETAIESCSMLVKEMEGTITYTKPTEPRKTSYILIGEIITFFIIFAMIYRHFRRKKEKYETGYSGKGIFIFLIVMALVVGIIFFISKAFTGFFVFEYDIGNVYNWTGDGFSNTKLENGNISLLNDTVGTYYSQGNYTSEAFDGGGLVNWTEIKWSEYFPYEKELPASQEVESDYSEGNINMTGNVLLLHFDNDSYYRANNTNVYDYSGMGHNGTVYINESDGNVRSPNETGKFGDAYEFDGTDDFVNVGNRASFNFGVDDFAISLWVKSESFGAILIDKSGFGIGDGYRLIAVNSSALRFKIVGNSTAYYVDTRDFNDGGWHQVVSARDGDYIRVYVDGEPHNSKAITGITAENTGLPLKIGCRSPELNWLFNGTLDEIAIWNRSLSASEIKDLYLRGALKLDVQTRTSNNLEYWSDWSSNHTNPSGVVNSSARYLQYRAYFSTENTSNTPYLQWVNISYRNELPANLTFVYPTPADGNVTDVVNQIVNVSADYPDSRYNDTVIITFNNTNYTFVHNETTWVLFTGLTEGTYHYYAWANTSEGYINQTETKNFTIDLNEPASFSLLNPSEGNKTTESTPFFNWQDAYDVAMENYTVYVSTSETFDTIDKTFYNESSNYQVQAGEALGENTYYWKVTAYDKMGRSTTSSTTSFTVGLEERIVATATSGGGGISGGGKKIRQKTVGLELIRPSALSFYTGNQIVVPLTLYNNGTNVLYGIRMDAGAPGLSVRLSKTFYDVIKPKEEIPLELIVDSGEETGNFDIWVSSNIEKPEFSDSIKFFVNIVEFGGGNLTSIEERLQFVSGYLKQNVECEELIKYLDEAKGAYNLKNYDEASMLAEKAMESCRDLVASNKKMELGKKRVENWKLYLLIVEVFVLIFVFAAIYSYYKKRRLMAGMIKK